MEQGCRRQEQHLVPHAVQDVIAYLRLAVTLKDDVALARIINVPKRKLGDTSCLRLKEHAKGLVSLRACSPYGHFWSMLAHSLVRALVSFSNMHTGETKEASREVIGVGGD